MPRHSREAMLRGIDSNRIIAGAYADSGTGGICPMLAAHRNGGRTDLSSFARCWDFFTGARRPRLATRREIATLRSYLEMSLIDTPSAEPISIVAERLRAERAQIRAEHRAAMREITTSESAALSADGVEPAGSERELAPTGERDRTPELRNRHRWSWLRPTRSYDEYRERLAAASEQMSERQAADLLGNAEAADPVAH
jgi:hypothetical protein